MTGCLTLPVMDQISGAWALSALRPTVIAYLVQRYREVGSIEGVAIEAGLSPRTLYRWRDDDPDLRAELESAGHVNGAGNVAWKISHARSLAIGSLSTVADRSHVSLATLAGELLVTPSTVKRWCKVYGLARVVKGKLK